MKHTEGKWSYFDNEEGSVTISANLNTSKEVVVAILNPVPKEVEANAKLIAAAPELFRCLENLNATIDDYWNSATKPDYLVKLINKHQQLSLAAIKKATE